MKDQLESQIVSIKGAELHLLPQKAIWWPEKSSLFLSDIHLGKAGHFRKNGIAVPSRVHLSDLSALDGLVEQLSCNRIFFLGDLFHSDLNSEWSLFNDWLDFHSSLEFLLIRGNHDILPQEVYSKTNLDLRQSYEMAPFYFTHEKEEHPVLYNISGHVHPGVRLNGWGRQGMRLPCFYFGRNYGLMPAFGIFTGLHPIKIYEGDRVYVVAEQQVIELNT
jgi:DNA ligase-associated metallophosphoesterase